MREFRPDTSNEAIGVRLEAVRVSRDLNQAAFADLLGLSSQRYGTYERGRSVPPPDVLGRVWQITGATPDYIILGRMDGLPMELATKLREAEKQVRTGA